MADPAYDFNSVDRLEKSAKKPVPVPQAKPQSVVQLPTGPPQPALQQVGFNGSINDFNERVAAATDAHVQAVGTRPAPGLAFDLARSPVPTPKFAELFDGTPNSQIQARSRLVAPDAPPPILTHNDLTSRMESSSKQGPEAYNQFLVAHHDLIADQATTAAGAAKVVGAQLRAEKNLESFGSGGGSILGGIARAVGQVASSLTHAPGGLYDLGKTIVKGDIAVVTGDERGQDEANAHFGRIVKGTVEQTKRDFSHPSENPGYLFLDILGLASAGAGTATRLGAAGRALGAGEGIGAAARAAVTKPVGGTFEIGREGAKENALLSDNPFVAAVQKVRLSRKQSQLDLETVNGEKVPSGLLSIIQPQGAKDFLDQHFSFEAKVGREADARRRVEHIVQTTVARELDHVAGGTVVQSRAFARMPQQIRNGLSRGEQKAIQTLSFGVTPEEQIAFHRRMIDAEIGDPVSHKRQIADLHLAQKILDNPNPSPRFKKAVELTQQVKGDMERVKVEQLGLSPLTAASREARPGEVFRSKSDEGYRSPAAIQGEINKLEGLLSAKHVEGRREAVAPYGEGSVGRKIERLRAELSAAKSSVANPTPQEYPATGRVEPFYTKLEPRGKQKRNPSSAPGFYPTKAGPFGVPAPALPAELTHEFTGRSIRAGDFRIDATALTSEAYARTVRAATVLNEHGRLWKSATDTPKTRFDVPIRDSRTIPDKLREVLGSMTEGSLTAKDAEALPADVRSLIQELYPSAEDLAKTPIEGVKWVDSRMMGSANEIPTRPGAAVKVAEAVNEPIRATILFLRPAYILNALGNAGMLIFHQGFTAIPSFARALAAKGQLGEEAVRTIDTLMGQGRSKSYTTAITPKVSRALAESWNVVTDQAFRRSSFLYEAKRLGYDSPDKLRDLVKDGGKDLVEIKRRANKALVEFDNLTPFEKNVLRHFIFVYPWVSRSAVWSLRSVMEHPLKTDFLVQLGHLEEDSDPIFKNVPAWFKQTGYFPLGWTSDGKPKIVNPTSINSFSTLGELTSVLGAGVDGSQYASFSDLLGPLPTFAVHAITGKDEYGNQYPGSQWLGAAKDVLTGLPQVSILERNSKASKNPNLAPIDIKSRQSIITSFNSALKRTVFSPGWLDGYGSLLAGGLAPRTEDMGAASARFWRDATPEKRHQLELTLLNKALDLQSGLLKTDVPGGVRRAVSVGADVDFAYKQFAKQNGRDPSAKERAQLLIDNLMSKGFLPEEDAARFTKALKPLIDETDIKQLRSKVFDAYAGGKALKQWDSDVRLVASFDAPVFRQKTGELYKQGLIASPAPNATQDKLYEYGRKYLDFTRKVVALRSQIKAGKATAADLRAFQDENDKPVDGLPSFSRVAWAYLPADQQQKAVRSNAVSSWSSLSTLDKELLGRPSDPRVTAGWAKLGQVVADKKAELARSGESFPAGYKRILAQYVQRYFDAPGLVKDYDFSRQPLYTRLQAVKPVSESPNADKWKQVLSAAASYGKYLKADGYDKSQVRQGWKDYVASTLQPWVDSDKGFAAEVGQYGKDVLGRLLSP